MFKLQEEEIPSFALKFSFQANMAFLIAVFILSCALAWALRDHRRRLLELATEEQEDRLYLTVLGILFCVCMMGSYYAFNRGQARINDDKSISKNVIIDELYRTFLDLRQRWNSAYYTQTYVPYAPDLPVAMPIPKRDKLEDVLRHGKDNPVEEYHTLAIFIFFFVILFSIWYFYPRKRPEISPPRDYMDAQGGMPTSTAGGAAGVAVGTSRSPTGSKSKSSRATSKKSQRSK